MVVHKLYYDIMHKNDAGETLRAIMEQYLKEEKRRFSRIIFKQPVQFQLKDPIQLGGSLSFDLSEGGVRIRLNDFIPLAAELTIQIQLTIEQTVDCVGRVVWVRKVPFSDSYHAGLEFIATESLGRVKEKIRQWIHTYQLEVSSLKGR